MTLRTFQCSFPDCHKNFKRRDYLTRHESNHSNVRPFSCPPCSIAFARKDLLDKHMRSKTHTLNIQRTTPFGTESPSSVEEKNVHKKSKLEARSEPMEVSTGPVPMDLLDQMTQMVQEAPVAPEDMNDMAPVNLSHVANLTEDSFGWLFGTPAQGGIKLGTESRSLFDLPDFNDLATPPLGTQADPLDFKFSHDTLNKIHDFLRSEGIDQTVIHDMFTMSKIDFFLAQYWNHFNLIFPVIHRATFDVNAYEKSNLNVTFLLSLITVGVVCATNDTSMYTEEYQVAITIQKKLRHHLYQVMDQCDLSFVPLKLLQSLLIVDTFHLYYGDIQQQTNFRIYHPVTINVLKEMKLFAQLAEPTVDPENFNYASWCQWIRYESLKRIAFFALLIDTQSTFFFGMTPSLKVFDIQLELPYSDSVWVARSTGEFVKEYKRLPREMIIRERAIDMDIQAQSCRYEDVFANGNLIPNVKSESHWPNMLWSLRRLMQSHGNVILNDREYDFDCFSLFGRLILVHGIMSLVKFLRTSANVVDIGLAAKVEHGFISWRTYFQFHSGGRATLNSYDASPLFWSNVTILHGGLLGLYCNFEMILNYTKNIMNEGVTWNHSPGRIRFDAIETTRSKILIQAWVKSRDGEHGLIQACIILKMVLNEEEMLARVPHLPYTVYLATVVCWVYFYREDVKWGPSPPPSKDSATTFLTSTLSDSPKQVLLCSMIQYVHFVLAKHSKWMDMDDRMLKELLTLSQML